MPSLQQTICRLLCALEKQMITHRYCQSNVIAVMVINNLEWDSFWCQTLTWAKSLTGMVFIQSWVMTDLKCSPLGELGMTNKWKNCRNTQTIRWFLSPKCAFISPSLCYSFYNARWYISFRIKRKTGPQFWANLIYTSKFVAKLD